MGQYPARASTARRLASATAIASPASAPAAGRRRARGHKYLTEAGFSYLAAFCDFVAILTASAAANAVFGLLAFQLPQSVESVTAAGVVVGLFIVLSNLQRGEYSLKKYSTATGQFARIFPVWNLAFLCALALGFASKSTDQYSRAAAAVFYVSGILAIAGTRIALARMVNTLRSKGLLPFRRLLVVGFERPSADFINSYDLTDSGMQIVSAFALRSGGRTLSDDLALASAAARILRPDDIFLAIPWSDAGTIEACFDAFVRMPAQIHLTPEGILDRYKEARVANLGALSSLSLARSPMSALQRAEKRVMDIVLASAALLILSPLLASVGLLIKLTSPGPMLFRQTRYGFNQEPFQICKFRTMNVLENDRNISAARRADPRVTGLGALLRRLSIDELPQLLNVLSGEMSLVGPRPHALAHDQLFERKIARYARRHNVKPGITGWAQVHGFRGEVSSDEKLAGRIEHDLYYIDNWSLWLDFKIMVLTIFSTKSHSNAF